DLRVVFEMGGGRQGEGDRERLTDQRAENRAARGADVRGGLEPLTNANEDQIFSNGKLNGKGRKRFSPVEGLRTEAEVSDARGSLSEKPNGLSLRLLPVLASERKPGAIGGASEGEAMSFKVRAGQREFERGVEKHRVCGLLARRQYGKTTI